MVARDQAGKHLNRVREKGEKREQKRDLARFFSKLKKTAMTKNNALRDVRGNFKSLSSSGTAETRMIVSFVGLGIFLID